jgi:hypothetical protein
MGFTPYLKKKTPYPVFLSTDPRILLLVIQKA